MPLLSDSHYTNLWTKIPIAILILWNYLVKKLPLKKKTQSCSFYRRTSTSATDSIIIDTLSSSIYSSADLSIFDPRNVEEFFNFIKLSNGVGKRAVSDVSI